MKAKRYRILLEALTPIAHGDTLTGVDSATNVRLFMRTSVLVNGRPARVPDLSENAIRSVVFRRPLALHLLGALGVERDSLPQSVVNLLFSGGSMRQGTQSPSREFEWGLRIRALYPSLELLGGAVDSFILPRSRLRIAVWPVAREFSWAIREVAPDLLPEAERISAYDLLGEETRTRGTGEESEGNQMLYSYEVLAAGSRFLLEATLEPATSEQALGAFAAALRLWDGYLGGQGRQGRGRMRWEAVDPLPPEGPYAEHIERNREAMKEGLLDGTLGVEKPVCT